MAVAHGLAQLGPMQAGNMRHHASLWEQAKTAAMPLSTHVADGTAKPPRIDVLKPFRRIKSATTAQRGRSLTMSSVVMWPMPAASHALEVARRTDLQWRHRHPGVKTVAGADHFRRCRHRPRPYSRRAYRCSRRGCAASERWNALLSTDTYSSRLSGEFAKAAARSPASTGLPARPSMSTQIRRFCSARWDCQAQYR